jgi:hypothetical protein
VVRSVRHHRYAACRACSPITSVKDAITNAAVDARTVALADRERAPGRKKSAVRAPRDERIVLDRRERRGILTIEAAPPLPTEVRPTRPMEYPK